MLPNVRRYVALA